MVVSFAHSMLEVLGRRSLSSLLAVVCWSLAATEFYSYGTTTGSTATSTWSFASGASLKKMKTPAPPRLRCAQAPDQSEDLLKELEEMPDLEEPQVKLAMADVCSITGFHKEGTPVIDKSLPSRITARSFSLGANMRARKTDWARFCGGRDRSHSPAQRPVRKNGLPSREVEDRAAEDRFVASTGNKHYIDSIFGLGLVPTSDSEPAYDLGPRNAGREEAHEVEKDFEMIELRQNIEGMEVPFSTGPEVLPPEEAGREMLWGGRDICQPMYTAGLPSPFSCYGRPQ
ncbi:unnamed protein product [Amoebophrya sp. A120]|nr:unnamed protein product [Amoebophrya sp. A120]|eukprot:GSA120T00025827001.1